MDTLLNLLQLLLEKVGESDGVSSKLADTLTELLDGHLVLVEVESEEGLILDVCLLGSVRSGGLLGVELGGNSVIGVHEVLEQVGLSWS